MSRRNKAPVFARRRKRKTSDAKAPPCLYAGGCGNTTWNKNQLCWLHAHAKPQDTPILSNEHLAPDAATLLRQTDENNDDKQLGIVPVGNNGRNMLTVDGVETGCTVERIKDMADMLDDTMPDGTSVIVPTDVHHRCSVGLQRDADGHHLTVLHHDGDAAHVTLRPDDLDKFVDV